MSKIIDFKAREFRFDETCRSLDGGKVNAGMRAYVTMSFGNTEVWEIGDWGWTWSQIRRDLMLEKNTDYVFRFSMEGGVCDTDDAVAIAHIAPKRDLEDRYSFLLDHNKFMPVICKRDGDGLLRIFELPFNTGEDEEWIIYLVAQHAVTSFFAPVAAALIENLPDISYGEWWAESRRKKYAERMQMKMNAPYTENENRPADGVNFAVASQEFSDSDFAEQLARIGDDCNIGFENVTVHGGTNGGEVSVGISADNTNIGFENCTFTSRAMSMIIAKLGDCCNAAFENVTVTEEGIDSMLGAGKLSTGLNIGLENVTLPKQVLDLIYRKLGDDCNIASENMTALDLCTDDSNA